MDFNNGKAIYLQIVEQITKEIISNKLKPEEKIMSVRELAVKYQVNPNTMQRALQELERTGLIYTERTTGKFVTKDEKLIVKEKEKYINNEIKVMLNNLNEIGVSKEEVLKTLEGM